MRILGIDPGTLQTGFGIIDFQNNELFQISSGIIKPSLSKKLSLRLEIIYDELDKLIKLYEPEHAAIETAFYGKNVQSAMKIGYAKGILMLAAVRNNLPVGEYSPREIKKAVVGNGAASKEQVQFMIKKLLAIKTGKMKFDESDALAAAVCHAFRLNLKAEKGGTWKSFVETNPQRIIE